METHFKNFQREMRKNMPFPEVILWQHMRNKQLGVKFRRQYTIGDRILDFYSPEVKLGIEIDGETHFINKVSRQKEFEKDKKMEEQGIKILRFLNPEIMENLEGAVLAILEEIKKGKTPSSILPLFEGEEGWGISSPFAKGEEEDGGILLFEEGERVILPL